MADIAPEPLLPRFPEELAPLNIEANRPGVDELLGQLARELIRQGIILRELQTAFREWRPILERYREPPRILGRRRT